MVFHVYKIGFRSSDGAKKMYCPFVLCGRLLFLYIIHRFYLFLFATASNNNMRLRKDNANHSFGVMNIIMPPLMQSLTQVKMYNPLVAQMCIALL